MKLCKDCEYIRTNEVEPEQCTHPDAPKHDMVSGIANTEVVYCADMRWSACCGMEGKWFKEKQKVPEPGEGYRLLEHDGEIQKGDEVWDSANKAWKITTCTPGVRAYYGYYRRKLEPPKPEEGYRFLEVGEKIKLGDEVLQANGEWAKSILDGDVVLSNDKYEYRRKLLVPAKCPDGHETYVVGGYLVSCTNEKCTCRGPHRNTREEAILAWNKMVKV